jgi:hypothetical protein
MDRPEWAPEGLDVDRPSAARIYDYLLGGFHNFEVDRAAARHAMTVIPDIVTQAQANRAFLHRSVRYLVGAGVRQFLDLGSGIPTLGNVHEIAQAVDPDARVVYVDIDAIAVEHSRQLLATVPGTAVLRQDMRKPEAILADPALRAVFDLSQPVAVILIAVLPAVPDADDPFGIVTRYRDALARGSYLVIAHGSNEGRDEQEAERLVAISRQTPTPITLRSKAQVAAFFDGFDLVEPGLTFAPSWRPETPQDAGEHPDRSGNIAGVGRKR